MSFCEVLDTQRGTSLRDEASGVQPQRCQLLQMNFIWLLLSNTHSSPAAALTLLPPLHSTASLNAAILAPVGPMIELWSPPGHIHTTGSVMKLWIFHRRPDTNGPVACIQCLLCNCVLYIWRGGRRRGGISPVTQFLQFLNIFQSTVFQEERINQLDTESKLRI